MPGSLFTDDEIFTFLAIVRETSTLKKIDGRVQRNKNVFAELATKLNEHFEHVDENAKTGEQVRTKWKSLKQTYLNEKRQASKSGEPPSSWRFFDSMQETMGHRPIANDVSEELAAVENREVRPQIVNDSADEPRSLAATPRSLAATPNSLAVTPSSSAATSEPSSPADTRGKKRKADCNLESILKRMEESREKEMKTMLESFTNQQNSFLNNMAGLFTNVIQAMNQPSNMNPHTFNSAPSAPETSRWDGFANYSIPD